MELISAREAGSLVRKYLKREGLGNKVSAKTSSNPFGGADKVFVTIHDATKELNTHVEFLREVGREYGFSVKYDGDGVVYAGDKDGESWSFPPHNL